MTRRLIDFARGLLALAATLALLIGVPTALAVVIGWPLPTEVPPWDVIQRHVTDADIPDSFVIKTLALIVWLAWAQLAYAIIVEFTAVARGRVARRAPVLPGVQLLAARLATWVTLMTTALGPAHPAMAAPLQLLTPQSAAVQVVDLDGDLAIVDRPTPALLNVGADGTISEAATANGVYITAAGDSWWDISQRLLSDGMRWREIRTLNLGTAAATGDVIDNTTETIRAGWHLNMPADANPGLLTIAEPAPPTQPDSTDTEDSEDDVLVTVEDGDHFWKLAQQTLTDSWGRPPTDLELTPYWAEMVETNRDRLLPPEDPDLIYPDQQFVVPRPPPSPDISHDVTGNTIGTPTHHETLPVPVSPTESAPTPPQLPEDRSDPTVEDAPDATAPIEKPHTATAPTVAPIEADNDDSLGGDIEDIAKPAAAIATGLGLLAALTAYTLRRLRRIQAARRRPGTTIEPPDDDAHEYERRIRAISTDGEDVRYITATNQYLAHQLEGQPAATIPSLVAMRAGQFGLELLLDEPCAPVNGFIAAAPDNTAWRLHPDTTARMMEAEATDAHPFAPGLLVVGGTDAGNLLVDFEQLGTVAIEGPTDDIAAFQRGLIASAIAAPWAVECRIVAIGIDGLSGEALSRVENPPDPIAWADAIGVEYAAIARSLVQSPYEQRLNHGEVYHPTLVFIGPDDTYGGIAQHLAPVAALAYSPLVVISGVPVLTEYRIPLEAATATLEPIGATFTPIQVDSADLTAADRLVSHASDTTAGPPTEQWARELHDEPLRTPETTSEDLSNGTEPVPDAADEPHRPDDTKESEPDLESTGAEGALSKGPSALVLDQIEQIMAPRPVEVAILGRVPIIKGCKSDPSPKLEAIIAYMAFHREAASQRLRDEFWPASTRRQAADNAIGRVRTLLAPMTTETLGFTQRSTPGPTPSAMMSAATGPVSNNS